MAKAAEHQKPNVSIDVVLFTIRGGRLHVLIARRAADARVFPGKFALPGGYVHVDEDQDLMATVRRVLKQKVGLTAPYLEQLATFGGAYRDPDGWSIAIAYYGVVPESYVEPVLGQDVRLVPVDELPPLPFDHPEIVSTGVKRLRGKSGYSSLPAFLLPETFTLNELQEVYEQVMGVRLEKPTFRRKVEAQGFVEAIPGEMRGGAHRPAQLYRRVGETLREFDQVF